MSIKKYLITGGAGFIGSNLSGRLIQLGHEVVIVDNLSTGSIDNIPNKATFVNLDLCDPEFVNKLPRDKFDAVCHLAAQSSGPLSLEIPYADLQANAVSTLLLSRWCLKNRISRFIYASSMAVYGNPKSLPVTEHFKCEPVSYYGVSKLTSENLLRLAEDEGLSTTSFRMFSVYGPGQNLNNRNQGMMSIYLSYLLEGSILPVTGSFDRFRDFVYIDDVIDAWVNAIMKSKTPSKVYNLGSGIKTTVHDLIKLLIEELKLRKDYPIEEMKTKKSDQFGLHSDIKRARLDLNFNPKVTIEEGVNKVVQYYK